MSRAAVSRLNAVADTLETCGKHGVPIDFAMLASEIRAALEASHHAELVSVLRELVYGGGGHVWAHARELLAKMDGGQ